MRYVVGGLTVVVVILCTVAFMLLGRVQALEGQVLLLYKDEIARLRAPLVAPSEHGERDQVLIDEVDQLFAHVRALEGEIAQLHR